MVTIENNGESAVESKLDVVIIGRVQFCDWCFWPTMNWAQSKLRPDKTMRLANNVDLRPERIADGIFNCQKQLPWKSCGTIILK